MTLVASTCMPHPHEASDPNIVWAPRPWAGTLHVLCNHKVKEGPITPKMAHPRDSTTQATNYAEDKITNRARSGLSLTGGKYFGRPASRVNSENILPALPRHQGTRTLLTDPGLRPSRL